MSAAGVYFLWFLQYEKETVRKENEMPKGNRLTGAKKPHQNEKSK
jgi:hypothetical protein